MNLDPTRLLRTFRLSIDDVPLDAARDWLVVLVLFLVLFLVSVAWNIVLFNRVVDGGVIGGKAPTTEVGTLDSLDSLRTLLEERHAKETQYRTTPSFVDPSL